MSPDREEAGDDTTEITYPSPGAEALDPGPFYHTNARETSQAQHEEPHHAPPETETDDVQQREKEHVEMQPQEPATPQQHAARPPNMEELQLAAQLGQGLAGAPIMPPTDGNMGVEDTNLRSIMPHPEHEHEQQQTPSYIHDTPTSETMMHGLPVTVGAQLPPHYAAMADNIPPRKRSKVSRACDECRRKKIKCDAQSDLGSAPCSSCARSNIQCLFSRVPQKRGPSKGYIKELADRIHSIENKLESEGGLTHEDLSGLFGDRSRPSNAGDDSNRKRPYSSISGGGEFESPGSATRQSPWASEPRPTQPAAVPHENHIASPYPGAALAPQPAPIRAEDVDEKTGAAAVVALDVSMTDVDEVADVDEGVLQDYLATLQTLYPILPENKGRLQSLLTLCQPSVRTAFVHALLAVAQSSSGNVRLANALLSEYESNDVPRTQTTNIVHAQTLLLLIIDADWRGSPTLPSLLGRAVALANSMKLWQYASLQPGSDPDSDENLCVRIWWSLVLMDRWHAVGKGQPLQIPNNSAVVPAGLESVVGVSCFYLIRLSKILSTLASVIAALPPGAAAAEAPMASILADYIENYREDLPDAIDPATHPLVHLSYWHCRLAIILLTPGATHSEILWPTKELINLLSFNSDLRSPLANHFGFLVAMALSTLSRMESSREEAVQLTKDILEKPGGVWDGIRDKLSEQVRPTSSSGDAASLQHLADLATAHQGVAGSNEENAAGPPSLTQGYLIVS